MYRLQSCRSREIGLRAWVVALLLLGSTNTSAQSDNSELLFGVRIGLLHPSGVVVWPVDTTPDEAIWFGEDNWRDRDDRRRQAMEMSDHAIMAWKGFKSLLAKRVMVVVDGKVTHSVVRGIVRIPAGCGEFEPAWYASTTGYLAEPKFLPSEQQKLYRNSRPVLVLTEENNKFSVHAGEVFSNLPKALKRALVQANIPIDESEVIRTKNIWTLYGDRVTLPSRLGASRSTWARSDSGFYKLHEVSTSATLESFMKRITSDQSEIDSRHYQGYLGRIELLLANENNTIFLTKYIGYESDKGKLERLHNGELQTLRVDGFDRGC